MGLPMLQQSLEEVVAGLTSIQRDYLLMRAMGCCNDEARHLLKIDTDRLQNWKKVSPLFLSKFAIIEASDGQWAKDALTISHFDRINSPVGPSSFVSNLPDKKLMRLTGQDNLPVYPIAKGLDVEDIQTFYAGGIINYQKCPYFYRLREVWGYKPKIKPIFGYGSALHYCLRQASELIKNEGYSPVSAITTSVEDNFFLPFANDTMKENAKKKARKTLINFVRKYEEDMKRIKEVESRLEFPVQRATITGKVDVILHNDKNFETRDYKTSDTVTTVEEASLQVQLYTMGLKMLGNPVTKGSLALLEDAITKEVAVDEKNLQSAKGVAEKHIKGIMNKEFNASPGKFCEKCDYRTICKWRK